MVEPVTTLTSLGIGGAGAYLLGRYWQQRNARLRSLALAAKYSTTTRIGLHEGNMRLLVNLPQVGEVPSSERLAWPNGKTAEIETSWNWTWSSRCTEPKKQQKRMKRLTTRSG